MLKRSILVVANVTATSDELVAAMRRRAEHEPTAFTLIVPASPFGGGTAGAREKLDQALEHLRDSGLEVDGSVGHCDPIVAVTDSWDPRRYDEIVVSTLPQRFSKWLHAALPERVGRLTGAPVTHVVSQLPKPPVVTVPPRAHDGPGDVMGPLSVLAWGAREEE